MNSSDVNGIERATLLTQQLLDGRELTTAEAAQICGVSPRTARRDFNAMSRVMAIYRDDDGFWRVLGNREESE